MTTDRCAEADRVEELWDGRLDEAEASRVEVHVGVCSSCADRLDALDRLRRRLAELPPAETDEGSVSRGRDRLLAAVSGRHVTPPLASPWLSAGTLALLVGSALVAALFALFLRPGRDTRAPGAEATHEVATHASTGAPIVAEIEAAPGSRWSKQWIAAEREEQIDLHEGELFVKVLRREAGTQLCVHLPDGEIEDMGTSFVVRVENGRTSYVAVTDGKVVLQLRDRPERTLGAGEYWVADAESP